LPAIAGLIALTCGPASALLFARLLIVRSLLAILTLLAILIPLLLAALAVLSLLLTALAWTLALLIGILRKLPFAISIFFARFAILLLALLIPGTILLGVGIALTTALSAPGSLRQLS
jgi:hypothetical protein